MCAEKKGNETSACIEKKMQVPEEQGGWAVESYKYIKKTHTHTQKRPEYVEHLGILGICTHAFVHSGLRLDPTQHKFLSTKTSGKQPRVMFVQVEKMS